MEHGGLGPESAVGVADAHVAAIFAALGAGRRVLLVGGRDEATALELARTAEHVVVAEPDALDPAPMLSEAGQEWGLIAWSHPLPPDLAPLRLAAAAGRRVIVRIPNGGASAGLERAAADFPRREGWTILFQHLAHGSLVLGADGATEGATIIRRLQAEPEYAHAFLALANVDLAEIESARAHAALVLEPRFDRYLHAMQRSREHLAELNLQLARDHLGVGDSAAASAIDRDAAAGARTVDELREALLAERAALEELRARLAAPRYRTVDALHRRVTRLPGARRAATGLGGWLRRRSREGR